MTAAEYRKYQKTGKLPGRLRKSEDAVDIAAIVASAASNPSLAAAVSSAAASNPMLDYKTDKGVDKTKKAPARPRHIPGEMNKTEAAFANEFLEAELAAGRIWEWRFESFKLKLAKNTTYSPDFIAVGPDGVTVYEVKGGYAEDDGIAKWKIAADMFWWMTFKMAFVKMKKGHIENIEWREYRA